MDVERVKMWLKVQANLSSTGKRESMETLLRWLLNIMSMYGADRLESMVLTIETIGDKAVLQDAVSVAGQLEGTRYTFEELPS